MSEDKLRVGLHEALLTEGDRPVAFVWELQHRLPADLYTTLAAAAAA